MGTIVSIIGAGGKTTSLLALARSQAHRRVLLTTTTHILPAEPPVTRVFLRDPEPEVLLKALQVPGIVCAGTTSQEGKLSALDPALFSAAAEAADLTVCEADGAHRRPLKLHRSGEPVIPQNTDLCLLVLGLSALGKPRGEVIHRFDRNPQWAASPENPVSSEDLLFCAEENIAAAGLPREKIRILFNQQDHLSDSGILSPVLLKLQSQGYDCRLGSMKNDPEPLISWLLP